MTAAEHGFAGFLDGYKAYNYSNRSEQIAVLMADIIQSATDLQSEFNSESDRSLLLHIIRSASLAISSRSMASLGNVLRQALSTEQPMLEESLQRSEKFRKIMFSFLEAAKISTDPTDIDLAIDLGNVFKLKF